MVPEIVLPIITPVAILGTVFTLHKLLKNDFNGKMVIWSNELKDKVNIDVCHSAHGSVIDKIEGVEKQVDEVKQAQIITQADIKEILKQTRKLNGHSQ